MDRDYAQLRERLDSAIESEMSRDERMQAFVDAAWDVLAPTEVSWLGFYTRESDESTEMILGPRRDKPACSPIALDGACGRSCLEQSALVVTDVAKLSEGYIACDPKDMSELVIPLVDGDGFSWGVFDLDSYIVEAFDECDAMELSSLLHFAGLTTEDVVAVTIV